MHKYVLDKYLFKSYNNGFEAQEQTSIITSVTESHPLCDILHLINTHIYEVYMYQISLYIL